MQPHQQFSQCAAVGRLRSIVVSCVCVCVCVCGSRAQTFSFFFTLPPVCALGKEYNSTFFFPDAAEFDTEACRAYPVASTDQAKSSQDLLLKTSREYAQILQKNYMI